MMGGRLRAGFVIALIVVCSALAGAAIDRMTTRRMRHMRPGDHMSREQDAKRRAEMLDKMTKELSLSTAQRAGIDSVMRATDTSLRAIRGEMEPRLRKVFEGSRAEMLARLDAEQRTKFEKMMPQRKPR
ncbi:MAG TPA: hypothetical protein VF929_06955 [Gemmatimonadaceae bacterium]